MRDTGTLSSRRRVDGVGWCISTPPRRSRRQRRRFKPARRHLPRGRRRRQSRATGRLPPPRKLAPRVPTPDPRNPRPAASRPSAEWQQQQQQQKPAVTVSTGAFAPPLLGVWPTLDGRRPELPESRRAQESGYDPRTEPLLPGRRCSLWEGIRDGTRALPADVEDETRGPHGRLPKGIEGRGRRIKEGKRPKMNWNGLCRVSSGASRQTI